MKIKNIRNHHLDNHGDCFRPQDLEWWDNKDFQMAELTHSMATFQWVGESDHYDSDTWDDPGRPGEEGQPGGEVG